MPEEEFYLLGSPEATKYMMVIFCNPEYAPYALVMQMPKEFEDMRNFIGVCIKNLESLSKKMANWIEELTSKEPSYCGEWKNKQFDICINKAIIHCRDANAKPRILCTKILAIQLVN